MPRTSRSSNLQPHLSERFSGSRTCRRDPLLPRSPDLTSSSDSSKRSCVSTPDADRRIAALEAQQVALQSQIDTIRAARTAQAFSAVQITEPLQPCSTSLAPLRLIFDSWRTISRRSRLARGGSSGPGCDEGQMVGQLPGYAQRTSRIAAGSELLFVLAVFGCPGASGTLAQPYATGLPPRRHRSGVCVPIDFSRLSRPATCRGRARCAIERANGCHASPRSRDGRDRGEPPPSGADSRSSATCPNRAR